LIGSCGLEPCADAGQRIGRLIERPTNTKHEDKLTAGRQAEVASDRVLKKAEKIVLRACKLSRREDYVPRLAVARPKAA
jgi:hypothetical protein